MMCTVFHTFVSRYLRGTGQRLVRYVLVQQPCWAALMVPIHREVPRPPAQRDLCWLG